MSALFRTLYYGLKPHLPWPLRLALRQRLARWQLRRASAVWPVDEAARIAPHGWSGWPERKRFALVLTHDVEGPEGYAKCERLRRLEAAYGFRSSFNFIPEGGYTVEPALRERFTAEGWEVGVHDLHHDGKLFASRAGFTAKARRINHYLRTWKSEGYRSGFMLRQLDWLHELEIAYDASTFDTDPFEPQPEGAGTIFPYWIPARAGARETAAEGTHMREGYVELPYTLPQDSTLFSILRDAGPERWLRKLDWVAAHGGMALVNVHPDYLRFPGDPPNLRTFDVAHYIRLLEHVRARHGDACWQPLPCEVAHFVQALDTRPTPPRSKHIGMICHSDYMGDTRVMRYAEALASRGDRVEVISLRGEQRQAREETLNGVTVVRVQDRLAKDERTALSAAWPLLTFTARARRELWRRHRQRPFDLVHVHTMPDFLIFCATPLQRDGTRLVLDVHDLVPEFFASKFRAFAGRLADLTLRHAERQSAQRADHIILASDLWRERYTRRTGTANRCQVMVNHVDTTLFYPRTVVRTTAGPRVLFPGGLEWHQGVDLAIRAFAAVRRALPTAEFMILGDGREKQALRALASELGLEDAVHFLPPVPAGAVPALMAAADLGVVPKRADGFGNEAYSTKIMEFMAVGVPVVVADTAVDRHYFTSELVRFFPAGEVGALADAMQDLLANPHAARAQAERALRYAGENCWQIERAGYLALVDTLCASEAGPEVAA
jgi:glycosyltransferase involved in cell wall biosynthesis/peptidoglycan/xylan/chitin deacetylase (PgdA/CDA1 family)